MSCIWIELPWPPSVNHYWRSRIVKTRAGQFVSYYISAEGVCYRNQVAVALFEQHRKQKLVGNLTCVIHAFPPDRRARDLDNLLKATLDSLQSAGLYANDNAISTLCIFRREPVKGGKLNITITEEEPA